MNQLIKSTAFKTTMVGPTTLKNIAKYLKKTETTKGDVVEMGSFKGVTATFMDKLTDRTVHVYDSFEGLSEPSMYDTPNKLKLKAGSCAAPIEDFDKEFTGIIHKGWFEATVPRELPDKISFAFIDCDFHDPTLHTLYNIWRRLSLDGVILVHDYSLLDGVTVACNKFVLTKQIRSFSALPNMFLISKG